MAKAKSDLPAKLRIGCSGWGYDDWLGGFYPEGTPKSDYLKLYSNTFDVVEVDSSYYRIPQPAMTATWRRTYVLLRAISPYRTSRTTDACIRGAG